MSAEVLVLTVPMVLPILLEVVIVVEGQMVGPTKDECRQTPSFDLL